MKSVSNRIVPDTSIIIDGKIAEFIEKDEMNIGEVVIPLAVVDELQAQASKGQEVGFIGLNELKKIQELSEKRGVTIRFVGERPSLDDIKLARSGRIDGLIMDVAKNEDGTLITADYVQALVAEAKGVKVRHIPAEIKTVGLAFEKFFTSDTLSVHLKEGVEPLAKKGKPGKSELQKTRDSQCTAAELEDLVKEIFEATKISKNGFIEISRSGASVLQLGEYRIAITRPPFSDGIELTIIRPIVKLTLGEYALHEKLLERLRDKAEGVLIAGPPGSGKTTFASSLAEFYMQLGKIVKTLESPRDMQVRPEITQYGPLEGDFEKTAEILLLVRPDYTVFDEIRKTRDFKIFADMRLAGVGMIGVVHASDPIDAIQRFIGRVELGMIPHIIDTIIFIKYGEIKRVLDLSLLVKVPTGMVEADLARPVVEVRDFLTGDLEYEVYTFGEENIIVPVSKQPEATGAMRLAADRLLQEIRKFDPDAEAEFVSDKRAVVKVENHVIPMLIGREGATISKLEEKLGVHIDVEPRTMATGREAEYEFRETGNCIEIVFPKELTGKTASVYVNDEFLFSATIGKKGRIRVTKKSELGRAMVKAIIGEKKVKVLA